MVEDKENGIQRWTAKRRPAHIISILRGETSEQEAARQHGFTVTEFSDMAVLFPSEHFFLQDFE